MKLTIALQVEEQDARAFLDSLNGDNGLRSLITATLLTEKKAVAADKYTRLTIVLGQLSRAFITAVETNKRPTQRQLQKLVNRSTRER